MILSSVADPTSSIPSTLTPTGSNALGKDEFLKLMMAQLANQDPTAPQDNQAFIAQLAQFYTVEQLQTANSQLGNMVLAQASSTQTNAASLVGKNVQYTSNALSLTSGTPASVNGT